MQELLNFLTSRPALNLAELERLAGLPKRTLYNALNGHKPFPSIHAWPLCVVLCDYGLELHGYTFRYDEAVDSFFIESRIDREPEVIGKKSCFEYKVWMYRHVLSDETDLTEFIHMPI